MSGRKIGWILLGAALLAGAGWSGRVIWRRAREARQPPPTPTAAAEVRDVREVVSALGEIAPYEVTDIKSEISGRLAKLWISEGQTVTNGQLLAELDQTEVVRQRNELTPAIESARILLERAERDLQRLSALDERGFVTNKDLQDAQANVRLARAELALQEARLLTAEERVAKSFIRSPRDGVVINSDALVAGMVVVGATSVSQGTVLMQVANLAQLAVKVDINEVDVGQMTIGMPVEVRFDFLPDVVITGRVERIAVTGRLRDRVRVFPVQVAMPAADPRIRTGISARVDVPLREARGVVTAPVSAVFSEPEEARVVFAETVPGAFEKRAVETGLQDNYHVEIRAGLRAGERLALVRPAAFSAGRVRRSAAAGDGAGRGSRRSGN